MTKKFKDIVKQNPEPARGKSGTSPMDPWNAKSGLAEASEQELLHRYLKSRGINPEFIPKDTKIAHSKSSAFLSWRKAHEFDESVEILEATDKQDVISLDIPLMIRMLELAREDVKDDMELHRITERLIEIRKKGTLTMDDYEFIAGVKKLKEEIEELSEKMKDPCWKGYQMVGMKDKGGKKVPNCVPEEKELKEWTLWDKISQTRSELWRVQQLKINEEKKTALDRFRAAAADREKKHNDIEKNRQEKLHQDPSKVNVPEPKSTDGMTSAIDRLEKHLNKEEVEQIDEMDTYPHPESKEGKKLMKAWKSAAKKYPTNLNAPSKRPTAKQTINDLLPKLNKTFKKSVKENTLDAKAATEAPTGPGEGVTEVQKQRSKSARMIKNLYKKKNMKEETYDWEKDDKTPQKLGKGVKIEIPKKEANFGENKPEARIVMSGGKTMTGEKRDTVEVDPLMAKRNDTPDQFEKPNKK